MEQNSFKSSSQTKKKVKKITMNAAIVLSVVCLLLGLFIGKAMSSGKINDLENKYSETIENLNYEKTRQETLNKTKDNKIAELEAALAEAEANIEQLSGKQEEEPVAVADVEPAAKEEPTKKNSPKKSSKSPLKTILTVILVIIILACVGFAATIFIKKNNRADNDDDDYFDDDDYEDAEYYEDDEYDEYEDDEYDDDEYEDDEYEDDDED